MGSGCNEIQINLFDFKIDNFQKPKAYVERKNDNKTKQKATTTKERQNP